jgi:hypothetical protein
VRRGIRLLDDTGAAIAEFVMVSALLTLLTLSVLQLGLALLVRNTLLDSAAEGARFAALADNTPADGVIRTKELISATIGPGYANDVTVSSGAFAGYPVVAITVRAPLPLLGLIGLPRGVEVSGHAAIEQLG